jgi:PncC family amidohydrolase
LILPKSILFALLSYAPAVRAPRGAFLESQCFVSDALGVKLKTSGRDAVVMEEAPTVLATRLSRRLTKGGFTMAVAESCTGGLLSSTLTDISGASKWFSHGWVTYSNEAKASELGIPLDLIEKHGAVSTTIAAAMAEGARLASGADLAISITGIAGPRADDSDKEIGTVHVGVSTADGRRVKQALFGGTRAENKDAFVTFALRTAIKQWDKLLDRDAKADDDKRKLESREMEKNMRQARQKAVEEAMAATRGPWQGDVWSESGRDESVGDDVEWSEGDSPPIFDQE